MIRALNFSAMDASGCNSLKHPR